MKLVFCVLLGFLINFNSLSQSSDGLDYVLSKEQIVLKGRTNINRFQCKLDLVAFVMDSLKVKVKKVDGDIGLSGLKLHVPVKAFNCKYRLMTSEFRDLLNEKEYPYLNLSIGHVEHVVEDKMTMLMDLTVADSQRRELIKDCYIKMEDDELILGGNHRINLKSYNIDPPRKFFGAVVVRDELDIFFEVIMTKNKKSGPN